MAHAEEAMRVAHHLRPGDEDNFSVETADALVDFWKQLTKVLFTVVPAMVAIGIVVGGIVIMNIMLMSVRERTHEIGLRKSVGARRADILRQFLAESVMLAVLGGALGAGSGWGFAALISVASPLPSRVTTWSIAVALTLGAGVGVIFGVVEIAGPTTFCVMTVWAQTSVNPQDLRAWIRYRPDLTPADAAISAKLPEVKYASIWGQIQNKTEYAGEHTNIGVIMGADE